MPGQPKRDRVVAAMKQVAQEELGPDAEALDYVCDRLSGGLVLREISAELIERMGEQHSVEWLRGVVVKLTPDAKEKMALARAAGAVRHAEDALAIADEPAFTSADVQRNRLRADVRRDLAKMFNPELRENKIAPVQVASFGQLLLAAHLEIAAREGAEQRRRSAADGGETTPAALSSGETESVDYETVSENQ
jgi:hypothetical protein